MYKSASDIFPVDEDFEIIRIPVNDKLNIAKDKKFVKLLEEDEKVIFSCNV